jgi:shikimate kinase
MRDGRGIREMLAWAGISIVNALPLGLGATVAINLRVLANIVKDYGECVDLSQTTLLQTILSYFKSRYSITKPCIKILSQIPSSSGLKSSSAVAIAIIKAITQRYNVYEPNIPQLAAELSKLAGVSFTGALDDAAAAYYGGMVFTDNTNMRVIRVCDVNDDLSVAVLIPSGVNRPRIDINEMRRYSSVFQSIFERALQGDVYNAMTLNGITIARILYKGFEEVAVKALKLGALAAGVSGNGPALFAVFREGDEGPFVELFSEHGKVLIARFVRLGEGM